MTNVGFCHVSLNVIIIVLNIQMKQHKSVNMYGPTMQCNIKTYYQMLQLSAYSLIYVLSLNLHCLVV